MLVALRHWMVVLLMFAMPLQGMAAVTMRLCGAMHGAPPMSAPAATRVGDPAVHAGCHDANSGEATADVSSGTAGTDGSCSACAACGLTAGAACATPEIGIPGLLPSFGGVLIEPAGGWQPERLERPPRSL